MEQNKAFSLPKKRLAGNSSCLNCGTELAGPFCHYCGQPDKNLMRFFPVLLRELAEDFLDFDSRFMRTLKPLLFKPGKLTRDYLDGRRFRYTPPLRLYIFASIAFFFLAAFLASNVIDVSVEPGGNASVQFSSGDEDGLAKSEQLSQQEFEEAKEAIAKLDPALQKMIAINEEDRSIEMGANFSLPFGQSDDASDEETTSESVTEDGDKDFNIQFNDEPWDRENNPLIIPFMPQRVNDWLNDEIAKSPEKAKAIEENPNLIVDQVFDVLPVTVFILLPLAALIMKFWYLFARKYYVEHLIFALHNHSFLFVLLLILLIADLIVTLVDPAETGMISRVLAFLYLAVGIWVPLYFFIALKTVYRQGWLMTSAKYVLVGTSYFLLLSMAAGIGATLSFLLL